MKKEDLRLALSIIGRKGGKALLEKRGTQFFKKISKIGLKNRYGKNKTNKTKVGKK
jgi:hypothetical protein